MGSPPFNTRAACAEVPVWLAAAEGDRTIPPERSTSVAQDLPHARTMRIPNLGHLAHEEDPEVFDALFEEMVTKTAA